MTKKFITVIVLMSMLLLYTGCSGWTEEITYSNLVDYDTQMLIAQKLEKKGVKFDTITALLKQIADYNQMMGEMPTFKEGFITVEGTKVFYPLGYPIEMWAISQRPYSDLTSRLIAYEVYKDLLHYSGEGAVIRDRGLLYELSVLDSNPMLVLTPAERYAFSALYERIQIHDIEPDAYVERIQNNWEQKGISFNKDEGIHMINCFVVDEASQTLFVAEAGVMLRHETYFIYLEKYGELYPYQATKFKTYRQLKNYLIERLAHNYPMHPKNYIIMKNDISV